MKISKAITRIKFAKIQTIIFLIFILLINNSQEIFAQNNYLRFDPAACKSFIHPAHEVVVIDRRGDTNAYLGRVRIGIMNKEQSIKSDYPLSVSLQNYYTILSQGKTAGFQKLVIVLYTFLAYEGKPVYAYQNAHFNYAADYFVSGENNKYKHLGFVDTVISVEGMEVTKKLVNAIDSSFCSLYESLFSAPLKDTLYSYDEVLDFEKKRNETSPAYRILDTSNAVYYWWDDFKLQQKTVNETIYKKSNVYRIKYLNESGKLKIKPAYNALVIAFGGQLFYNLQDVFYPMYKKGNDFYVVANTNLYSEKSGWGTGVGYMFGVVGGIAASRPPQRLWRLMSLK